ncbi:MAG: hypothetical protein Q4G43_07075 [Mobilicoccus sp.]|nr:hypothetical protein [Mobilicoccus sp.]
MPFPLIAAVTGSFDAVNENFPSDAGIERWEAFSPTVLANTLSNPVVINHHTADVLVPLDQVTARYAYDDMGESTPEGFDTSLWPSTPGVLGRTFVDELGLPHTVTYTDVRGREGPVAMPVDDAALVTINVYDDGPPETSASHHAADNATTVSHVDFLAAQFARASVPTHLGAEKLTLLIERYAGHSVQLPAHEDIDDTVYGSVAIYREEIIESLRDWARHHDAADLDALADEAITTMAPDERDEAAHTWAHMKERVHAP